LTIFFCSIFNWELPLHFFMEVEKNLFYTVKSALNIVEVISHYVVLKQVGSYLKGLSPFTQEKTPSFTVTPSKGIFYCFSSQQGGDVIDFISKIEQCSQLEAALFLAKKYQIAIKREFLSLRKDRDDQFLITVEAKEFFAQWCFSRLSHDEIAIAYLKKRGLYDEKILRHYMVGVCPDNFFVEQFMVAAYEKGILLESLMNAGVMRKDTGGRICFVYEERIIFPIRNSNGSVSGFGGRIYREGDERVKYINASKNSDFLKREMVYGFYEAKKSISEKRSVYIVEGFFDVIASVINGYHNVIATMGTAFTKEQIDIVAKYVDTVFIAYDGDGAGQRAIKRMLFSFLEESIQLMVIELPSGDDPASLHEKNIFVKGMSRIFSGIQFLFATSIYRLNDCSLKEKIVRIKNFCSYLGNVRDPIQKSLILHDLCSASKIPISVLSREILASKKLSQKKISSADSSNNSVLTKDSSIERLSQMDLLWHQFCSSVYHTFDLKDEKVKQSVVLITNEAPDKVKLIWIPLFEMKIDISDMIKNIQNSVIVSYLIKFDWQRGEAEAVRQRLLSALFTLKSELVAEKNCDELDKIVEIEKIKKYLYSY